MENRPLPVVAGLIFALLLGTASAAEGMDPVDPAVREADWDQRLARARQLQDEARQRQQAADAGFEAAQRECQSRFLVNACIDQARRAHLAVRKETRAQEIEANALERAVKREQLDVREIERQRRREEKARQIEASPSAAGRPHPAGQPAE